MGPIDPEEEARAEDEMEQERFAAESYDEWRYDRDEDYLRERADVEAHGQEW